MKRRGITLTHLVCYFDYQSTSLHRLIIILYVGVKHACGVLVCILPLVMGQLDCLGMVLLSTQI